MPGHAGRVRMNVSRDDEATIKATFRAVYELLTEYSGDRVEPFAGLDSAFGAYGQLSELAHGSPIGSALQYIFRPGTFHHEAQVTPIGLRTPNLAISDNAEVAQMPGVYIAGPGSFPRLGLANPSLSIIATSRILADHIMAI